MDVQARKTEDAWTREVPVETCKAEHVLEGEPKDLQMESTFGLRERAESRTLLSLWLEALLGLDVSPRLHFHKYSPGSFHQQ